MKETALVDLSRDMDELNPRIIALRRELHRPPEPAFEGVWTAAILAERMRGLGLAVQEGIGGTGVLAVLEGARPGQGVTEIGHRPGFDVDEDVLPVGVQIMSLAALELLQQ